MTTQINHRRVSPTTGLPNRSMIGLPGLLLTALALAAAGCNSINSVLLQRNASNTGWEREGNLQGIPITLKVPTHIKLYVYNKHFLELSNVADNTPGVRPVNLDVPIRDFASEFMYTDKVFTVDFKRPAGGAINLRLKMTDQQYFESIQQDVTDQTIRDVTSLLGNLFMGSLPVTAGVSVTDRPNVSEVKSLVAVGVFEIADPQFMPKVQAFLNCHINKAHDAWVAPPGVTAVGRVGVAPTDNLQVPYPPTPLCPDGNCGFPVGVMSVPSAGEGVPSPHSTLPAPAPHGEQVTAPSAIRGVFPPWAQPNAGHMDSAR